MNFLGFKAKIFHLPKFYTFIIIFIYNAFNINAQSTLITGQTDICQGDSSTLVGAAGYTTYRWSNGATNSTIKVGRSGRYFLTVTDGRAIPSVDSFDVTVHNLPIPNIEGSPYICFGRSTSLSIQGNYRSIQWSTGERTNQIFASSPMTISVNVIDNYGCTGASQITIRDGSQPYNSLADTVKICRGDSAMLDATTPFARSYYWNTDDTTATITVRDSGRYNVIVSSGLCVNYDTIHVIVLPPPMVNLGVDTAICRGDTLVLRAEKFPLYSYKWTDSSTESSIKVFQEGLYGVEVTFGKCRASDSIDIVFYNRENGKIIDTISCTPQLILNPRLRGTKSFKWSNGRIDSSLTVSKSNSYQVLMSNSKCVVSWFYNLTFKTPPSVFLGNDTLLCQDLKRAGMLLKGGETGLANYIWQDSSRNPTFEAKQTGLYSVKVINECGEATDDINIEIKNCFEVFVPNSFSPNSDGQNDILQVYLNANIKKVLRFQIYDRWGNQVFATNEFMHDEATKNTWDGRYKGKFLTPNVFAYWLEFETYEGHILQQKGDITLMR